MGLLSCDSQGALMCCEPAKVGCGGSQYLETITPEKPVKLRVFSFKDLETATNGFSRDTFLGKGSHGSVYKGILRDGKLVAVKRPEYLKDESAFDNELEILSTLHSHRFVNLLGFSKDSEDHEKLLVVDFMPNGTLYDIIHYCPEPLTWAMRAHLALQSAKSVNALHSASPPVIHRDIKSANILIDGRWNAKLGDFGLALRGHMEDVLKNPAEPAGTPGYIDPAYETPRRLSTKSDVFSFGVLLMELISGREAVDTRYKPPNIIDWAMPLIKQGNIQAVFDPKLPVPHQQVKPFKNMVAIAARCVRRDAQKRPTMAYVAAGLEEICERVPLPEWIGLAGVMKRSHMQGPELPVSREFGALNNTSAPPLVPARESSGSLRVSYDGQNGYNVREHPYEQYQVSREHSRDFYRDLGISIKESSREFSSTSSREHLSSSKDYSRANDITQSQLNQLSNYSREQHSESRESSFRKIRRDSRESSRDHVREPQQPRPTSRGPSRDHSRAVSREQSKEWSRSDHSRITDHSERNTDLTRELTRDVVEASLNHIRKWRNCAYDHSKDLSSREFNCREFSTTDKIIHSDKSPDEEHLEVSKTAAAAFPQILPSKLTHRRNKSDGSLSFLPEDLISKEVEGPSNLKKRSSSGRGSKRILLKAKELVKEREIKATMIQQPWSY